MSLSSKDNGEELGRLSKPEQASLDKKLPEGRVDLRSPMARWADEQFGTFYEVWRGRRPGFPADSEEGVSV